MNNYTNGYSKVLKSISTALVWLFFINTVFGASFAEGIGINRNTLAVYSRFSTLKSLENLIESIEPISSQIPYPVPIFMDDRIDPEQFLNEGYLKDHIKNNLFYRNFSQDGKSIFEERVLSLIPVVTFLKEYMAENYPDLEIKSISVQGSFIYGDNRLKPGDIDLLVIVKGSYFKSFGDEIEIDYTLPAFRGLQRRAKELSIRICGEDNFKEGNVDPDSSVSEEYQKRYIDRVVSSPDTRVVLYGNRERRNYDIIKHNREANVCTSILGLYKWTFSNEERRSDHKQISKAAGVLYQIAVHLLDLDPTLPIDLNHVFQLRYKFEAGEISVEDVINEYLGLIGSFKKISSISHNSISVNENIFGPIARAKMICELIEKRAEEWEGKTIEQIYADDMLIWKKSTEPLFEGFDPTISMDKTEINILIPGSKIRIRYYDSDPGKNTILSPFTNWGKTKTHVVAGNINRQILHDIDLLPISEDPTDKYMQSENYFYSILSPKMKDTVLRRVEDLRKVEIETEDGETRTIPDFIKYVLSDYGYEDRIERIMVFGSYLFSGKPKDIDIKVGIKGNRQEDIEFISKIVKLNYSDKIKDGSYRVVFPKDSITPVSEMHFTFDGEGFDSSDRQEYLAQAHLMSPVILFGNRIYGEQIEGDIFLRQAIEKVETLLENIFQKRTLSKLDSKKAIYRLLHASLILRKIDPSFAGISPERVYEFIAKYYTEGANPYERAIEALEDLKKFSTPEKCRSIIIPFLMPFMSDIVLGNDEEKQLEAIEILTNLARYGNFDLEGLKSFSVFQQSTSLRVKQSTMVSMMRVAQESSGKEDYLPEVDEIAEFLKTKKAEIDESGEASARIQEEQEKPDPFTEFVKKDSSLISTLLVQNGNDLLLRIPIEVIELMDQDNVRNFFDAFQHKNANGYIELFYASGDGTVNGKIYQRYGLRKKPSTFEFSKENTITLMPAMKVEISTDEQQARRDLELLVATRIGNLKSKQTQIIPIGYQNDTLGIMRGALFGLVMIHVAREKNKGNKLNKDLINNQFLQSMLSFYSSQEIERVNLTDQDIIDLATGGINQVIPVLRKLIDLLPIEPIDARQIYENTRQVWIAA